MRKFITIVLYTIIVLIVGRNLAFLPRVYFETNKSKEASDLRGEIAARIKYKKGAYSVLYTSFTNNRFFGINDHQVYTGASVNKIPIITVLYHLAHSGEMKLDENVTMRREDVKDYGTGVLRYQEPGSVYSLKTLAKLSLQQSDNTAVYLIATHIGMDKIQKTINAWGLTQTDMANNKTSLADMKRLFEKIYKREVTSDALTQELLGFMTNTDIEDRLPRFLPKDARVYHKTGDTLGSIHDVGIVERNGNTFFIGVMTSDIAGREEDVAETIGEIAKKVFAYEERQQ